MRRLAVSFIVMLGLAATAAAADTGLEAALKLVPENMGMVFATPSVEKMIGGAQAFAKAIGVPENAVKEITVEGFLNDGPITGGKFLDPAGPIVMVASPKGEQLMVGVLKDAKGWREDTDPNDLGGGLFELDKGYTTHYAAIVDGLLVESSDKALVQAAAKGDSPVATRLLAEAGPLVGKSLVLVYIDMKPLRPMIQQYLPQLQLALPLILASQGGVTPGAMAAVNYLVGQIIGLAQDMQTNVIGVSFDAEGASLTALTSFGAETKTGKFLAAIEPGSGDLLRGLPATPTALAFAFDWKSPEGSKSITEQLMDAVLEATPSDPNDPAMREALETIRATNAAMTGANCLLQVDDDGKIVVGGNYFSPKPDVVLKGLRTISNPKTMAMYMSMFGVGAEMGLSVKSSKTTIGGTEVDVFETTFDPNDPTMAQGAKMVEVLYGKPMRTYIVGAKTGVALAFGGKGGAKLLEQMLAGGEGFGATPGVKAALADLPPKPVLCVLADPVAFARVMMNAAKAAGAPVPDMKLPQGKPVYGALAAYFVKNTLRIEARVPTACIKPIVEMIEAAESGPPTPPPDSTEPNSGGAEGGTAPTDGGGSSSE